MISDNSVDYCSVVERGDSNNTLSFSDFRRGLRYARENFYTPVIVYDENDLNAEIERELENYEVLRIKPINLAKQGDNNDSIIVLNSGDVISLDGKCFIQVILHICRADILNLNNLCKKMFVCSRKVNIILDDWEDMTSADFDNYRQALEEIADTIIAYAENKQIIQINVLSDMMLTSEKMNCGAGNTSIVLAPNAEFYPCISFYKDKKYQSMGNLDVGITEDISIYQMGNSPVCSFCDISSCRKCVYNNIEKTREIKIPSIEQCKLRGIEKAVAVTLQKRLLEINPNTPLGRNKLIEHEYPEVLEYIVAQKYAQYR